MHGAQVHDREGRANERPATLRVPSHVAAGHLDSGAYTRFIALRTKVNNKRPKIPPNLWATLSERARRHLLSVSIIENLDAVELQASAEQFAVAARIAARVISQVRHAGSRRMF